MTKVKAAVRVGPTGRTVPASKENDKVTTTKARVVKYRTHRGVYTCVVKEGNKYASFVCIDDFPIRLQKELLKPTNGKPETYYMDEYPEYPLVRACKTMLFIGNRRGITDAAKDFLEDILKELKQDVKVITATDIVSLGTV